MHTVKWVNELVARMNHGIFITFEGVEGSGKTTQVEVLADRLQQAGHPVITTREPGGTPISDRIRAVVLDQSRVEIHPHTEALLMCAARAQLVNELIRPSLLSAATSSSAIATAIRPSPTRATPAGRTQRRCVSSTTSLPAASFRTSRFSSICPRRSVWSGALAPATQPRRPTAWTASTSPSIKGSLPDTILSLKRVPTGGIS